jgi:hypothetical protein
LRAFHAYDLAPSPPQMLPAQSVELCDKFGWWNIHCFPDGCSAKDLQAQRFILHGGACTLQGLALNHGQGDMSYSLDAFLCHMEGAHSWGQMEQIRKLLAMLAQLH